MNDRDSEFIAKLRSELSDLITPEFNDFDLLRWLQGHDYNLDVIIPKLKHHLKFIRCYDFSKHSVPEVLEKYWPCGVIDIPDSKGNFVYIDKLGTLDGEGVLKCVSMFDVALYQFYITEERVLKVVRKFENETGHQAGVIILQDLIDAPLNPQTLSLLAGPYRALIGYITGHYAEVLRKCVIVNAPSFVHILYNMVKPILPEKTKQKVVVLGSNWKTDILKHVDPDTLPVHWGGNLVDEFNDPQYKSKVVMTSKVPQSFYFKHSENYPPLKDFDVLTVSPWKSEFVTVNVNEPGQWLEWIFYTDDSYGFGLFYTQNENECIREAMEMIFPQFEYNNGKTVVPERGKIKCKKCGFYKLWFNNEFSWFMKLTVRYKVNVIPCK